MVDTVSASETAIAALAASVSEGVAWPFWPLHAAMSTQADMQNNVFLM